MRPCFMGLCVHAARAHAPIPDGLTHPRWIGFCAHAARAHNAGMCPTAFGLLPSLSNPALPFLSFSDIFALRNCRETKRLSEHSRCSCRRFNLPAQSGTVAHHNERELNPLAILFKTNIPAALRPPAAGHVDFIFGESYV